MSRCAGTSVPADRAPPGRAFTIAIDGPAASGKTTLGAALAERLRYRYFDSGVMYRALTWLAVARRLESDETTLADLATQMNVEATSPAAGDAHRYHVYVAGRDVTRAIRSPEVDRAVSAISAYPRVRQAVTERLRGVAAGGGIVMVGRDIGTVVLPNAHLKIYLTASDEERARRRCLDLAAQGQPADYDTILSALRLRDRLDSQRQTAPMRPADDALQLATDGLSLDDELSIALRWLAELGVAPQGQGPEARGQRPEARETVGRLSPTDHRPPTTDH